MAATMKLDTLKYLTLVLGADKAEALLADGWKFEFGMYSIAITAPGGNKAHGVDAPASPSKVLTGQITPENLKLLKSRLAIGMQIAGTNVPENWVNFKEGTAQKKVLHEALKGMPDDVYEAPGKTMVTTLHGLITAEEYLSLTHLVSTGQFVEAIKQYRSMVNCSLVQAKDYIDTLKSKAAMPSVPGDPIDGPPDKVSHKATAFMKPKDAPTWSNPATMKVKLVDATALGQPVEGTSAGSTYYVIALSDKVKLAARVQGNKLSIRAEGQPSESERAQFNLMGMTKSDDHWSNHFGLAEVPLSRVIGAILLGSEIEWTAKVETAKQLKMALHV